MTTTQEQLKTKSSRKKKSKEKKAAEATKPREKGMTVEERETKIHQLEKELKQQEEALNEVYKSMTPNETKIVGFMIDRASTFLELKDEIKKTKHSFQDWLESKEINTRMASRLTTIGKNWGGEKRPTGSLLEKLPTDVHKLEALSRLKRKTLEDFVAKHDCKRMERAELIKLVPRGRRKTLGGAGKRRKGSLATYIESRITTLLNQLATRCKELNKIELPANAVQVITKFRADLLQALSVKIEESDTTSPNTDESE
jgi:hypothetical protein